VLVLTRRANQSIMIGHEIVVTVLEVRGDQVRLGIKAPRSIDVHREEIFAQLQQANRDAVTAYARCRGVARAAARRRRGNALARTRYGA
jgi:carbon storage regulator